MAREGERSERGGEAVIAVAAVVVTAMKIANSPKSSTSWLRSTASPRS